MKTLVFPRCCCQRVLITCNLQVPDYRRFRFLRSRRRHRNGIRMSNRQGKEADNDKWLYDLATH